MFKHNSADGTRTDRPVCLARVRHEFADSQRRQAATGLNFAHGARVVGGDTTMFTAMSMYHFFYDVGDHGGIAIGLKDLRKSEATA
jgi:hypothetical protein